MQKILLINGAKEFAHSGGKLSALMHQTAKDTLLALGKDIKETSIDSGYDLEDEVQKILWCDALILQMPGWWMGEPWIVKKYIDEVFTQGGQRFCTSDGRHRVAPTEGYGTGGVLTDKHYMFSLTYNAPIEAFTRKGDFFENVGVDGVYLHLHKAYQFIGMKPLDTFIANDVIKNPQVELYKQQYTEHLKKVFKD